VLPLLGLLLELRLLRPLPEAAAGLLLLIVGLAFAFAGGALVKGLVFLGAGLVGSAVAVALLLPYLPGLLLIPVWVVGFLLGGLLSLLFLPLGVGLLLGYMAYWLAAALGLGIFLSLLVGGLLFLAGLFSTRQVLGLVTAAVGGLLTMNALLLLSSPAWLAALLGLAVGIGGLLAQLR